MNCNHINFYVRVNENQIKFNEEKNLVNIIKPYIKVYFQVQNIDDKAIYFVLYFY